MMIIEEVGALIMWLAVFIGWLKNTAMYRRVLPKQRSDKRM